MLKEEAPRSWSNGPDVRSVKEGLRISAQGKKAAAAAGALERK